jgi:hypothetical protein
MVNNQIRNILISDDVNNKCVEILENNELKVTKKTNLTVDQLKEEVKVKKYKIFSVNFTFNSMNFDNKKELRLFSCSISN